MAYDGFREMSPVRQNLELLHGILLSHIVILGGSRGVEQTPVGRLKLVVVFIIINFVMACLGFML